MMFNYKNSRFIYFLIFITTIITFPIIYKFLKYVFWVIKNIDFFTAIGILIVLFGIAELKSNETSNEE